MLGACEGGAVEKLGTQAQSPEFDSWNSMCISSALALPEFFFSAWQPIKAVIFGLLSFISLIKENTVEGFW